MRVMGTNILFRPRCGVVMVICVVVLMGNVFSQEVRLSVVDKDQPGATKVVIPAFTPALSQSPCGCGQEHVLVKTAYVSGAVLVFHRRVL